MRSDMCKKLGDYKEILWLLSVGKKVNLSAPPREINHGLLKSGLSS